MPLSHSLFLITILSLAALTRAADAPSSAPAKFTDLSIDAFEKMSTAPGVILLDVRTPEEFAAAHLKNALLIDIKNPDFPKKIAELKKDAVYLVYCRSGVRSVKACNQLAELNFPHLYNMLGGINAWTKAEKPTEK